MQNNIPNVFMLVLHQSAVKQPRVNAYPLGTSLKHPFIRQRSRQTAFNKIGAKFCNADYSESIGTLDLPMQDSPLIEPREVQFQLFEVLDALALTRRERHAEHSRETFEAALGRAAGAGAPRGAAGTARLLRRRHHGGGPGCGRGTDAFFYRGKLQACRWFFRWKLPRVPPQLQLLRQLDDSVLAMQPDWF